MSMNTSRSLQRNGSVMGKAHYRPPWRDTSIISIAGSSGSGKTSLALAIVRQLNLPWVIVLSMDSFYKPLTPEQSRRAFNNEYDFDAPEAIDFDLLFEKLQDIKAGKRVEMPIYSFEKHSRMPETTTIYSPYVLVLEGIFALHDQRVLDISDLKIFAEAEPDLCLSRRLLRDVKYRGRDIEGCIKQWFAFVKPNFHKYVKPQRHKADIMIPRGTENTVAISIVADQIKKILREKSEAHQFQLLRLGQVAEDYPLTDNAILLPQKPQIVGIHTLVMSPLTSREDFIFYIDRIACLLIEQAVSFAPFQSVTVTTAKDTSFDGLRVSRPTSAVLILRGGTVLESALRRVLPDCMTGRLLVQKNEHTSEPELHYCKLPNNVSDHGLVLLLDAQMSSGGAAIMAVQVLIDHGVAEESIVLVAVTAGRTGVGRILHGFPKVRVVLGRLVSDEEQRWVENRYLGC